MHIYICRCQKPRYHDIEKHSFFLFSQSGLKEKSITIQNSSYHEYYDFIHFDKIFVNCLKEDDKGSNFYHPNEFNLTPILSLFQVFDRFGIP